MQILKFGGSSLATAERIAAVVDILVERRGATKLAVVVSAMGGVTDTLAGGSPSRGLGHGQLPPNVPGALDPPPRRRGSTGPR